MPADFTTNGESRRPTIRDVAAAAGVSKSLVSLVFATPESVSDERRARVLEAAERLGFRPNQAARSLAASHGRFVGVLAADSRNPVFADVIDAAREAFSERGVLALVTTAMSGAPDHLHFDRRGLELFGDMRPSGVLVVGSVPAMGDLASIAPGRPIVVASAIATDLPAASTVRDDDAMGVRLLVEHLVGLGHRRILHIGGRGGPIAAERADAYRAAMREHGLADQVRIEPAGYAAEDGRAAMERALGRGDPATAAIAVNDLAAVGVLTALRAAGRTMAVTGYDNTYLAGLEPISLTSIDPHSADIGAMAARMLLDGGTGTEILVRPSIVVRRSTVPDTP